MPFLVSQEDKINLTRDQPIRGGSWVLRSTMTTLLRTEDTRLNGFASRRRRVMTYLTLLRHQRFLQPETYINTRGQGLNVIHGRKPSSSRRATLDRRGLSARLLRWSQLRLSSHCCLSSPNLYGRAEARC